MTLDGESDAVRLVHYTTQEFFEKNSLRPLVATQESTTKACLAYLSFNIFSQEPCTDNETLRLQLQEYPFLSYAAVN